VDNSCGVADPKVSSPAKISDYRPISLLVCLSQVFKVLMARQMKRHIRCNNLLLTVFQSGFRRHHSTTAAVLKVTKDIRLGMENGKVNVLLLLDLSQTFDMVVHGLLLCKLRNAQNYGGVISRLTICSVCMNGRLQIVLS
jgi:hypothetical protein